MIRKIIVPLILASILLAFTGVMLGNDNWDDIREPHTSEERGRPVYYIEFYGPPSGKKTFYTDSLTTTVFGLSFMDLNTGENIMISGSFIVYER